ncbi:DUF4256 domain-containing protein [Helcococcus kunzii]|uniref:DUF4256 domain-containing protein n=1 Tax=Helcococcus kunzii ATCC 51366 TaxID=883114 RepID=H3NMZ3_9FIRM|nr:DUF4256 domain-containing protein [Helcococcus kunzii]EHR34397.1 hypothetical protein HMPREF9709_00704 [Helcococcus kunzii ATCC 51366]QZO77055.1 DUF4256 domain-containing protein [Helcococcus kunzii]
METEVLLNILKERINKSAFVNVEWDKIEDKISKDDKIIQALDYMEETEGEPNIVSYDDKNDKYIIMDTSKESPNRRSYCYDDKALQSRKKNKPENSAMKICEQYGLTMLNEGEYKFLQSLGDFDLKTSSWLLTPDSIRNLGGAIFGDKRYNTCFIYHNGADSYYAARGFRAKIEI